jgi:hypothetical protein
MYLAKFFHRAPGDDDRGLLLVADDEPIVLGVLINREDDSDEYLREEFSDLAGAVVALKALTDGIESRSPEQLRFFELD